MWKKSFGRSAALVLATITFAAAEQTPSAATTPPDSEPIQNLRGLSYCFTKDLKIIQNPDGRGDHTPLRPKSSKGSRPRVFCSVISGGYGAFFPKAPACPKSVSTIPGTGGKIKTTWGYEFGDPIITDHAVLTKEFTSCKQRDSRHPENNVFTIHAQDPFHHSIAGFACTSNAKKFDPCNMNMADFKAATVGLVQIGAVGVDPDESPKNGVTGGTAGTAGRTQNKDAEAN